MYSIVDSGLTITLYWCGLQPPMSQARLDIIDAAFNKMDKTGDGVVTVADLMKTYDVSRHPKFISGEKTEEQIIKKYLDVFQRGDTDDEVCNGTILVTDGLKLLLTN